MSEFNEQTALSKMGRPEIEIDMNQLAVFCRHKPTLADCAAFFKCSEDTVERRIKEAFGITFADFRDQNMAYTRASLAQKAIQKAEGGDNTMLIFCLKNLCGWRDKQPGEDDHIVKHDGAIKVSQVDLEERIRQLKERTASDG